MTWLWLWPGLLLALLVLFIAPGLAVAAWLHDRHRLDRLYVVPVAALVGCLVGYGTFCVWLAMPAVGRLLAVGLPVAELAAAVAVMLHRPWRAVLGSLDVFGPLGLVFAVALAYLGLYFGCVGTGTCVTFGPPIDNVVPLWFPNAIDQGTAHVPFGDWHYSDRPPLQAGVVLANALFTLNPTISELAYVLQGTLLQCLWLPAMWVLGRRVGLPYRRLAPLLAFGVCLGFFLLNSVFVWPKLLAAACCAFGVVWWFVERERRLYWVLGAASVACGLLSHTGVIFTLLPLGLLLLRRRFRPSWSTLGLAAGTGFALMLPWTLYQKVYDPPGDRLLKMHLAGVAPLDDRSFGQALVDAYSHTPLITVLATRLGNLTSLVVPSGLPIRANEFFVTFWAMGVLVVGFGLLAVPAVRRRLRRLDARVLRLYLLGGLAGLGTWVLLMFQRGATIIHQGSYLTMLLLIAGLAVVVVAGLPRPLVALLLTVHIGYFGWVWAWGGLSVNETQPPAVGWMLVGAVLVAALLWSVARWPEASPAAEIEPIPVPALAPA